MSAETSACRSTGMKPGATVFTVMPKGPGFADPAAHQPDLRSLGDVG